MDWLLCEAWLDGTATGTPRLHPHAIPLIERHPVLSTNPKADG